MGLIGKLKEKALSKILAVLIKKLAEGDFGPTPAKVYWFLAGKKTYIAVAFASVGFALQRATEAGICDPCGGYINSLYVVAGFLLGIGLLDGAVRLDPPQNPIAENVIRRDW